MKKPEGPPNVTFSLSGEVRFWELVLVGAVCLTGAGAALAIVLWHYWKT